MEVVLLQKQDVTDVYQITVAAAYLWHWTWFSRTFRETGNIDLENFRGFED